MEEIEYKLKKKNAILIVNAVAKLVDIVRQKSEADSVKTLELPEFKLLKQKCEDPEPLVSITACQGIVSLVELGILPWGTALAGLIAAMTSTKNYSGIITAVGQILVIDLRGHLMTGTAYKCRFSMRSPQHPLITILKQKQDCWLDIFNQIQFLCNHNDSVVANCSLELLRPLFLYILCAPSALPAGCRRQTWELLLRLKLPETNDFLMEILSWLLMNSESDLESTASLYIELAGVAAEKKDSVLCAAMAPSLASLAQQLVCLGHDPRSCIVLLAQLLQFGQEASSCVLMMMSEMIGLCPAIYLVDVFTLCKCIVEQKSCNLMAIKMLECALLQWLVYPSYLTGDAVQLGGDILALIGDIQAFGCHSGRLFANKLFGILRPIDSRVNFCAHLCRLAEAWQGNLGPIEDWLERVANTPLVFCGKLQLFLSALFVHNFEQIDVRKKSFRILLKLVEQQNDLSGNMLTLILYKLAEETEPKMQLELLRGLTQMAVQKENITLILHTLETLKNRGGLRSLVIDLYVRLWKVEPRCYPYLEKMLQETVKDDEDSWEFEIAKASAIKQICETRPELYSAELVSMLSKILTRCGDSEGSLASSLALEGISALCKAEIVDITTTYKALAPKLNRDKRPTVVKSWCEFLGVVPSIRCPTQEYEKLVVEVIMRLWSYVTNSEDISIVNAALSSLSKFNLDQLSLRTLPECYRQGLKLPSSYAKTPVDAARKPEDVLPYIPGECWMQLLQNIKPTALEAAGNMLINWINTELESFHLLSGRTEPASYSHLPPGAVSRAIVHYLIKPFVPEQRLVVKECLRILCHKYSKLFPPLEWIFLQDFLQEPDFQEYCLTLLARQAQKSPSARKLLEDFVSGLEPSMKTKREVLVLFSNLSDLCNSIPPNILKPFIEKSLHTAFEFALNGNSETKVESEAHLRQLLSHVKTTLQKEDIHDANRATLSIIAEGLLERLDVENPFFAMYVECAVELPVKHLERMSSPSVWWEVTPEKLRLAVKIRSALAQRTDTEVPLVWLNECIDATASLSGEHTNVLKTIAPVMVTCRGNDSNCPWTLELMGQIQVTINAKSDSDKQQVLTFLYDVFMTTAIVMSGHECLASTLETIATSREVRLQLFPQALSTLVTYDQWQSFAAQVTDWLFHMCNCKTVSPLYSKAFYQALVSLRHSNNYKESAAWMHFIDSRPTSA
ncbi:focadhesin [Anabrus simplex]|uniref:focadhesin n=1 Tax=Anabrus simplex TaxID=316456 RepID=UPI0035A3855C